VHERLYRLGEQRKRDLEAEVRVYPTLSNVPYTLGAVTREGKNCNIVLKTLAQFFRKSAFYLYT